MKNNFFEKAKKRLKNNKGVALVTVVCVFLVTSVFAMSVIYMTGTDARQMASDNIMSEDYYIAWSAANLVKNQMEDMLNMPLAADEYAEALVTDGSNYVFPVTAGSSFIHNVQFTDPDGDVYSVPVTVTNLGSTQTIHNASSTTDHIYFYIEGRHETGYACLSMQVDILTGIVTTSGASGDVGALTIQSGGNYYSSGGATMGGVLVRDPTNENEVRTFVGNYSDSGTTVVPPVYANGSLNNGSTQFTWYRDNNTVFYEPYPGSPLWSITDTTDPYFIPSAPDATTGVRGLWLDLPSSQGWNAPIKIRENDYNNNGNVASRMNQARNRIRALYDPANGITEAVIYSWFVATNIVNGDRYSLSELSSLNAAANGDFLASLKNHVIQHPEFITDTITNPDINEVEILMPDPLAPIDPNHDIIWVDITASRYFGSPYNFISELGNNFTKDTTIVFYHGPLTANQAKSEPRGVLINGVITIESGATLTLIFDQVVAGLTFNPGAEFRNSDTAPDDFARVYILSNPRAESGNSSDKPSYNNLTQTDINAAAGGNRNYPYFAVDIAAMPKNYVNCPIHIYAPNGAFSNHGGAPAHVIYGSVYAKFMMARTLVLSYIRPDNSNYVNVIDSGGGIPPATETVYTVEDLKTVWVNPN